jgi:hypothetical protein
MKESQRKEVESAAKYWYSAWVEPNGTLHAVNAYGHRAWALEHGYQDGNLENVGWVHVSNGGIYNSEIHPLNQPQIDTLFDLAVLAEKDKENEWEAEAYTRNFRNILNQL